MTEATAQVIFCAIMSVGVAIWCLSLTITWRARLNCRRDSNASPVELFDGPTMSGELTVVGSPENITAGLVDAFRPRLMGLYGAKYAVVEQTSERVMLKKLGAVVCNQPSGLLFGDALFKFKPKGADRVCVSYTLGFASLARLVNTIAVATILGFGLPIMLLVGSLIWFLVIPSPEPAVRWQVLQTVQIAHVLWPPFLFFWILSHARRKSKAFVEQLVYDVAAESATLENAGTV